MMKQNFFEKIFGKFIARQLRRPTGFLANKFGEKMNESNKFLYNLTFDTMNPKDNDSILEIGFGNGKFFDKLFSMAKNLTIYGIDFSTEMVSAAKKNNPTPIKSGKLSLQTGNSDKLPFADNSFDKVFCINVVYFWENPAEHLREIRRVLKPGGKLFCGLKSKENMLKMPFTQYHFTLYEDQELAKVLQNNGLAVIEVVKKSEEMNTEELQTELICFVAEK